MSILLHSTDGQVSGGGGDPTQEKHWKSVRAHLCASIMQKPVSSWGGIKQGEVKG